MNSSDPLTLNRRLLARKVAEQVDGLTVPLAAAAVEVMLETVAEVLASGGSVHFSGFGTFQVRYRKSRQTRHPRTQDPVTIPAAHSPAFTPSPQLRQRVNEAFLEFP